MTKKTATEQLDHVEASLRRWHTRLKIASNKIEKLVKRRRSLMLKLAGQPAETKATVVTDSPIPLPELDAFFALPSLPEKQIAELVKANADDLTIPPDLRRTTAPGKPGPKLLSDMINKPFIDARKKKRLEKMDEKRRGRSMFDKSDMPLTGRDALKAIRAKKA